MMDFGISPYILDEVYFKTEGDKTIYIVKVFANIVFDGTAIDVNAFAQDARMGDPLMSLVPMDQAFLSTLVIKVFVSYGLMQAYAEVVEARLFAEIDTSESGIADFADALTVIMTQDFLSRAYIELAPPSQNSQQLGETQ